MGRLADAQPAAGRSSAPSIHSLHALDDDDEVVQLLTDDDSDDVENQRNDKPPAYDAVFSDRPGPSSDVNSASNNTADGRNTALTSGPRIPTSRLHEADYQVPGGRKAQGVSNKLRNTRTVTLEPTLSHSPRELFSLIAQQARQPPRPRLVVTGSHTDSSRPKKHRNQERVIDFDFHLDLAETLLAGWEDDQRIPSQQPCNMQAWHNVQIAEDYDGIKAYRGSRMKTLTWTGAKKMTNTRFSTRRSGIQLDDPESRLLNREQGDGSIGEPELLIHGDQNQNALLEWCTRFCNDPSPVKSFTLTRELHNFEHAIMIDRLTSHIRDTNYRGEIAMRVELVNGSLTIYSPHWINKLRNNRFIFVICLILQLWLIAWPVIWLLEKRYEVVYSRWYASHTAEDSNSVRRTRTYARGCDEHTLAEFWAPAVKQAAWGRRRYGELISMDNALRADGLTTAQILRVPVHDSDAEIERRRRVDRGDGTFLDSVIGFVRGISEARRGWNLTAGWGENT